MDISRRFPSALAALRGHASTASFRRRKAVRTPVSDQAFGDLSESIANSCERLTRSRWAVYSPLPTMNTAPVMVQISGTSPKMTNPRMPTHNNWLYENGASTEASAYLKASTTIHWPAVDARPMRIPNAMSCQLGVTQTNGTSAVRMQAPTIDE